MCIQEWYHNVTFFLRLVFLPFSHEIHPHPTCTLHWSYNVFSKSNKLHGKSFENSFFLFHLHLSLVHYSSESQIIIKYLCTASIYVASYSHNAAISKDTKKEKKTKRNVYDCDTYTQAWHGSRITKEMKRWFEAIFLCTFIYLYLYMIWFMCANSIL